MMKTLLVMAVVLAAVVLAACASDGDPHEVTTCSDTSPPVIVGAGFGSAGQSCEVGCNGEEVTLPYSGGQCRAVCYVDNGSIYPCGGVWEHDGKYGCCYSKNGTQESTVVFHECEDAPSLPDDISSCP